METGQQKTHTSKLATVGTEKSIQKPTFIMLSELMLEKLLNSECS